MLVELARMGKTIFFSTHILADVAEICTHVGIVEAGKLVASGNLEEMQRRLMPYRRIHVTVLDKVEEAKALLVDVAGVRTVEVEHQGALPGRHQLVIDYNGADKEVSAILSTLIKKKFR